MWRRNEDRMRRRKADKMSRELKKAMMTKNNVKRRQRHNVTVWPWDRETFLQMLDNLLLLVRGMKSVLQERCYVSCSPACRKEQVVISFSFGSTRWEYECKVKMSSSSPKSVPSPRMTDAWETCYRLWSDLWHHFQVQLIRLSCTREWKTYNSCQHYELIHQTHTLSFSFPSIVSAWFSLSFMSDIHQIAESGM